MASPTEPFPFTTALSLQRLADFWDEAGTDGQTWSPFARIISEERTSAPALLARNLDAALLREHASLVDLMLSAVIPRAQWEETVAAIMPVFGMEVVYATPMCERLDLFDAETLAERMSLDLRGFELGRTMMAYYFILAHCFGVHVPYDFPLILSVVDEETGLDRHFKLLIDTRFAWVEIDGACPELSDEDLAALIAAPTDRPLWHRLLPPERFILHGFGVVTALDVTDQHVLSALKDDLLQQGAMTSESSVAMLEPRLRSLLRCPSARFGLICLEDGELSDDDARDPSVRRVRAVGRSLLLSTGEAPFCPSKGDSTYARAIDQRYPVVVPDLLAYEPKTGYEYHLLDEGFRSVMIAPLRAGNRTVGLLELASPEPGAINAFNTMKVDEVAGLFATAMRRSLDERRDHVQAVIKSQCTAIHPVVEWRFREAALRYLEHGAQGHEMEPIVFPGVIPLYGFSDIRRSSSHRNEAIADDLVEQLSLAFAVLVEASSHRSLPGLDELGFRIQRLIDEIGAGLSTEHEVGVVEFVQRDVESLFDHLARYGPGVKARVDAYRDALDPSLGVLYASRKRYEKSVTMINEAISSHIERQEVYAQALAPHYFEKYKTDGVEYTIYVGDALIESGDVDPLALRNLRLWQLMTTCGTAWALDAITPDLPMPLETAHLILVQSAPLAIRFRYDEKQFDVDGAYNTRYEILKKRIDKALIAGTEERLTQPGHLAIVLSHHRDLAEYRVYLDYLRVAGYVSGPVETLSLEPVPGVQGLQALRVPIAAQPAGMEIDVTPALARQVALEIP